MAKIEPLEVVVYGGNADPQTSGGEDEFVAVAGNGSIDAAQEDNADLLAVDAEVESVNEEVGAGSDDPATGRFMEPMKGMIFDSENDAVAFSQRYAREKGFAITRRTSKTVGDKLQYFTLACNRQGKPQCSSSSRNKLKDNPSTKTQCPAKLNFRLHGTDKFCLTSLILEHNHDLSPSKTRVNVCQNKTTGLSAKRRRQESSGRSEICANKMVIYTHAQGGGSENQRFVENECADDSKEETRLHFSAEDTHVLYRYFFRMQSKDPNFFYAMDFDENSRLRNVFWADARSRAAYESFSDVVKFDTAYITNKYEVPLASFVGLNHHGEPILLGCGLLSNQNTKSFVWLFKSWLACMSNRPPKGMITDQCDEMQNVAEHEVETLFHYSTRMKVGNGRRTLFWTDRWIDGRCVEELAPCLLQAVPLHKQKTRTVCDGMYNRNWVKDITGALTVQVILDYLCLWERVSRVILQPAVDDMALWRWTADHTFTTASAYKAFFAGQYEIHGAKVLHKTRAPAKCKFFVWIAIHGRCWTAARRKRHHLQRDDTCVLCDQDQEEITHLLLTCSYSRSVWHAILLQLGWSHLTPTNAENSLTDWWLRARKRLDKASRKSFDSLVVLLLWSLWLERNARTFNRCNRTAEHLVKQIEEEASLWVQARFSSTARLASALGSYRGRETIVV